MKPPAQLLGHEVHGHKHAADPLQQARLVSAFKLELQPTYLNSQCGPMHANIDEA